MWVGCLSRSIDLSLKLIKDILALHQGFCGISCIHQLIWLCNGLSCVFIIWSHHRISHSISSLLFGFISRRITMKFVLFVHYMSRYVIMCAHSVLPLLILGGFEAIAKAIDELAEEKDPIDPCSSWRRRENTRLIEGRGSLRRSCARAWENFSFNPIRKSIRYSIWKNFPISFTPSQLQVPQVQAGL